MRLSCHSIQGFSHDTKVGGLRLLRVFGHTSENNKQIAIALLAQGYLKSTHCAIAAGVALLKML
ncbi:MAG: hypothetical protein KME08_02670 [Aphanothece sp. CMT-3BRIN-NPC111]|jgi:hypothetical protein|nr:hypothetical protein [Aphanothece sp. CMT-3BRIN-NPC111]